MAEPGVLALRSALRFAAGTRESDPRATGTSEIEALEASTSATTRRSTAISGDKGRLLDRTRQHGELILRRRSCSGHRRAGQPAAARRQGREPAERRVPARRPGRLRWTRPSSWSAPATRRSRTRSRCAEAEPRHPRQSQRGVRALQGGQPHAVLAAIEDRRVECRYGTDRLSRSSSAPAATTAPCWCRFATARRPHGPGRRSTATASSRASARSRRASSSRASACGS